MRSLSAVIRMAAEAAAGVLDFPQRQRPPQQPREGLSLTGASFFVLEEGEAVTRDEVVVVSF